MSNIKPVTYNIFRYDDIIYMYFLSIRYGRAYKKFQKNSIVQIQNTK